MKYLAIPVIFFGFTTLSSAEENDPINYGQLGRIGFALWDCASYAALFEEEHPVGKALFDQGHAELSSIVEAWRNGLLDEDDINEIPVGVAWNLIQGPSIDFSLGFMWAKFLDDAHDKTWPNFTNSGFDKEREFQAMTAETEFREKNCELLLR